MTRQAGVHNANSLVAAQSSGVTFINVNFSTLLDKWVGESEKMVTALFTVAHKLAPSIIFLDEIDLFLSRRSAVWGTGILWLWMAKCNKGGARERQRRG